MDHESAARQAERDSEYLRACREAGIAAELPSYELKKNPSDVAEAARPAVQCNSPPAS